MTNENVISGMHLQTAQDYARVIGTMMLTHTILEERGEVDPTILANSQQGIDQVKSLMHRIVRLGLAEQAAKQLNDND